MTWTPLLAGAAAQRALDAVSRIAADLSRGADDWYSSQYTVQQARTLRLSLAHGLPGVALFLATAAQVLPLAEGLLDAAADYSEQSLAGVDEIVPDMSLYNGLCGIVWGARTTGVIMAEPFDSGALDEAIATVLEQPAASLHYDLTGGLTGIGIFLLQEDETERRNELLECVIERLQELAVPQRCGIGWRTPASRLMGRFPEIVPNGYYNVALAHGAAAVISFLSDALPALGSASAAVAASLLNGAADWVVSTRLDHAVSAFPDWVASETKSTGSRLAWCYGDPGIAIALAKAGRATGRGELNELSAFVAHGAALRDPASSFVADPAFCHGAAGLGHLFNRLHQHHGDPALATAARFWFDTALSFHDEAGFGGFPGAAVAQVPDAPLSRGAGVLIGSAGIGLALSAAVGTAPPVWDAMFAINC